MKARELEIKLLKGDVEHWQNNANSILKLFKERPQRRKERLERFNGTDLHTFFYMINENEWYNTDKCKFNITIDNSDVEQELTIKEIKEQYKDYYVCDYDLTHEIINDNYEITGWIDLYKDNAQIIIHEQYDKIEKIKKMIKLHDSMVPIYKLKEVIYNNDK